MLEDTIGFAGPCKAMRANYCLTIMDFGFEMVFFAVLALILFGPRKLPQIAREVGRFMAEFKRAGNQFQTQVQEEIRNLELEESINSVKNLSAEAGQIMSTVKDPNPVASALGRLTDRIKNVPQDHDA
jgi:sec-independent protein translocase protein TatB